MKNNPTLILCVLIISCSLACAPRQLTRDYDSVKIQQLYSECIEDAAKPQSWEVSRKLVPVTPGNQQLVWKQMNGENYLLVSSWKADTIYYKNDEKTGLYNTGKYPIWVTTAPQLQNLCQSKKFGRKEGLDLRLKQLFGMPPNVEKKYFVEFWVKPQDLYRPCPDPEISDGNCGLAFPESVTEEHKSWVNDQRLASYYNADWDKNYPWTQLGYTYDWHPKSRDNVGLSEFIIATNKDIIVAGFKTTEEYCAVPE